MNELINPFSGHIDAANLVEEANGSCAVLVQGWLLFHPERPFQTYISICGSELTPLIPVERQDVSNLYPEIEHAKSSGFIARIPLREAIHGEEKFYFLVALASGKNVAGCLTAKISKKILRKDNSLHGRIKFKLENTDSIKINKLWHLKAINSISKENKIKTPKIYFELRDRIMLFEDYLKEYTEIKEFSGNNFDSYQNEYLIVNSKGRIVAKLNDAIKLTRESDAVLINEGLTIHKCAKEAKDFIREKTNKSLDEIVDIIVPIYNAFEEVKKCINSLFSNTTYPYRLIIIDDASTEAEVENYLNSLLKLEKPAYLKELIILRNKSNLGFISSVNSGMLLSKNNLVLLNSDTEVPPFWLERLVTRLLRDSQIASVTPFSNSATLCSFPVINCKNQIYSQDEFLVIDRILNKFSDSQEHEIPTAVGFCMAISRKALDEVGLFSADAFGSMYGEENDWCERAKNYGFRHLLASDLFVYHKDGATVALSSNTPNKKDLMIEKNLKRLSVLHPKYLRTIKSFLDEDPLYNLRNLLFSKVRQVTDVRPIMLVVNNPDLKGGTEAYLGRYLKDNRDNYCIYELACSDSKIFIYDCSSDKKRLVYKGDKIREETLEYLCEFLEVSEVFVNTLVGFDFLPVAEFLINKKLRYSYFIHDYFAACPSVTLLNYENKYCGAITDTNACQNCLSRGLASSSIKSNLVSDLAIIEWRKLFSNFLLNAQEVLAPSEIAKKITNKYYPEVKIKVLPHKAVCQLTSSYEVEYAEREILTFACIGAIGKHKGSDIIYELHEKISQERLPFRLVVVGHTDRHEGKYHSPDGRFIITGKYRQNELPEILASLSTAVVFLPSIWPETFMYTAQEALLCGYPVILFKDVAFAELVRRQELGWVLDEIGSSALLNLFCQLASRRENIHQSALKVNKWLSSGEHEIIKENINERISTSKIAGAGKTYPLLLKRLDNAN